MYIASFGLFLVLFCCVTSEDVLSVSQEEEEKVSNSREDKQLRKSFEHDAWKVVEPPDWEDSEQWIPKNPPPSLDENPPRQYQRRRIRKRKRRPAVIRESEESEEYRPRRRRVRPQTLDEINDSWVEIENESPKRPYSRRRTTPVYIPETITEAESTFRPVYEKVRNPFTALQEADAKLKLIKESQQSQEESVTISGLKTLLKQSTGSLSLSEILQQKNLSLQDLLKGKQNAISALIEKTEIITESTTEYKNIIEDFTELIKKTTEKSYESVDNSNTFSTLRKYEVIAEPTTERRIFVPSHPKHYTLFNYKPDALNKTIEASAISPVKPITNSNTTPTLGNKYIDYRTKYVSIKPKLKMTLPVTSTKLNKGSKPIDESITTELSPVPSQAIKIEYKDIFGLAKIETTSIRLEDGPMKIGINIEKLMESKKTTKPPIITEKIKPTSAREEIMEVLRDHVSRQNLSRILKLRNMTIEELVAQRERGSSQLHLADIFHNQTREPEPPNEPFVGHVHSVLPVYINRTPKEMRLPTGDNNTQPQKSKPEKLQNIPRYTVTSFPTYKIEMEKIIKNNQSSPIHISILRDLYPNLYTANHEGPKSSEEYGGTKPTRPTTILENEVQRVEEIENSISDAVNNELSVEVNDNSYDAKDSFLALPRGVKSAVIASAAIIGISLFVFLTMFCIFKWSQKQKKRFCYPDSFTCSRFRSPILEVEPRRTFKTIVNETLGRKKKYANVYAQSMSDHAWECDKKPFQ